MADANIMTNYFDDDFYRPPRPTTAGLMFPARSKLTVRGFTFAKLPAEEHWRQIISASQGERETCLLCLAMPDIWNLHDQPETVSFVDHDGKLRSHRFDYLAEFRNGSRVAIAVKPMERAEKLNFRATLRAIERDLPQGFADKVVLVTERQRHRVEVQNAELLNFFRRSPDDEADQVVLDLGRRLAGEMPIHQLIEKSGLGARAFRAVFRAIYAGVFNAEKQERITPNTIISPRKETP
ncbi:hypothetical protein [Aliiroseovarius zhejiangensis]|nr:hypothetical protein [Aliiroseovarius zhejiangensis]